MLKTRRREAQRRSGELRRLAAVMALFAVLAAAATSNSVQAQDEYDQVIRDAKNVIGSGKQSVKDKQAERERLREDAALASENLDVAQSTADDLIAALDAVRASVNAQQEAHDNARRAVEEAEAVQRDAEMRIVSLQEDLAKAEQALHDALIESYVTFQTPDGSLSVLGDDPWDNAREEALASFVTGNRLDTIDELRRLGAELERWQLIAEEATTRARIRQQEAAGLLDELQVAQETEAALVVAAEERLETRLYEVQTLKALDATLATEIEREERRIADALSRQRAAEEARRRAEEAARRAAQGPTQVNDFTLVWVAGFQVNTQIADNVAGLVAAMQERGFPLAGWGFRTAQDQIALRKAHCGSSEYAIYQMRASRCRPPTARPGRSNHERGLAIDFTYNGRIISSRSSAVFQAMKEVAPQFGLKNLPSEPWHWSINGR